MLLSSEVPALAEAQASFVFLSAGFAGAAGAAAGFTTGLAAGAGVSTAA